MELLLLLGLIPVATYSWHVARQDFKLKGIYAYDNDMIFATRAQYRAYRKSLRRPTIPRF